ncbi:peptidylprolyl isomerase [Empedobacter stercoris]|uniref:peptidylprolyl isomerase n=1 Tax=Empedobacter stercoris TaxID=1628248 RepID=UPI001DEF368B|nr:peptidylprolyl isomerase [Empedobacter stercoris]UWX67671.1 peptidylprolyl isomerase [Empedobacter stercoris]HJD87717.1 peptidylprolyl isomerase [Empedobacter falsenii]
MRKILLILTVITTLVSCGVKIPKSMSKEEFKSLEDGLYAKMTTNHGAMTIKLYEEQAPMTVANFVGLAEGTKENKAKAKGVPFYDGIIFHRVIKDFMIQGGDPDGRGTGGPGYDFEDEFDATLKHDKKGVLSMANSGPATNGSQFFITEVPTPWLDGRHTVFGQVVEGLEVVDSIANVEKTRDDKPVVPVTIEKVEIARKGDKYAKYNGAEAFDAAKANHAKKQAEAEAKLKAEKDAEIARQKELEAKALSTPSGLKYVILEEGNGAKPVQGDPIQVHYTLRLNDGEKLDSSFDRNQPLDATVGVTGLIQGWMEALTMFNRGAKVFLIIPAELGYGARGAGGVVPPNATLYFDMEVLDK